MYKKLNQILKKKNQNFKEKNQILKKKKSNFEKILKKEKQIKIFTQRKKSKNLIKNKKINTLFN